MAGKGCCESGCSLRAFLVVLLIVVGSASLGLSVFTIVYVPAVKMIEIPVWAGGPLLVAGLFSTVYCCCGGEKRKQNERGEEGEDYVEEEDSCCLFALKVLCMIFLAISFIVCLIAVVFCTIHIVQLFSYDYCVPLADSCICYRSVGTDTKRTEYFPVGSCEEVYLNITYTIMASDFLCLVGSIVTMTFLASIFRSRYGRVDT